MILSIFSDQNINHSLEIFFWMLGAFLIGLFFGRKILLKKTDNILGFDEKDYDELNLKDDITQIRATKTFERGGKEMIKTVPEEEEEEEEEEGIKKDDLQKINGIGPLIEKKLNSIGIFSYNQISKLKNEDLIRITEQLKLFSGKIERDNWIGQAFNLLKIENNQK